MEEDGFRDRVGLRARQRGQGLQRPDRNLRRPAGRTGAAGRRHAHFCDRCDSWRSTGRGGPRRGVKASLLYMGTSKWRKTIPFTSQVDDVARTIVTVWTKSGNFSFLAADLENGPILAPEYGFFVRRNSELRTKADAGATAYRAGTPRAASAREFMKELACQKAEHAPPADSRPRGTDVGRRCHSHARDQPAAASDAAGGHRAENAGARSIGTSDGPVEPGRLASGPALREEPAERAFVVQRLPVRHSRRRDVHDSGGVGSDGVARGRRGRIRSMGVPADATQDPTGEQGRVSEGVGS